MTQTAIDIASQVKEVNRLLEAGEPGNISTDEHSGYTGYKPQHIIDAMNDVFGVGVWGFEEVSSEIVPTGDKGASLAVAQVKVWLKDVPSAPVGWGQNRVTRGDIGDARKGAQTDAIKKALSYFSIGNRAYQGLLKEDSQGNHTRPAQPTRPRVVDTPKAHPGTEHLVNGNGSPAFPEKSVAITRGELFERGELKGMWTRMTPSAFYAMASAITGRAQSKQDWTMTADEMAEMARQIFAEKAAKGNEQPAA